MTAHGSDKNGLSWSDGQLDYERLRETINEAVSGYAHLYVYGLAKTRFLTELQAQPVRNLEDFTCPQPHGLNAQFSCSMPFHKNYLNYSCATQLAYTIQMAQASPSLPRLYQLSTRLYTPYRLIQFGPITSVMMTSFSLSSTAV